MIRSVSQLLYVSFLFLLKAQRVGRCANASPDLSDVRCGPEEADCKSEARVGWGCPTDICMEFWLAQMRLKRGASPDPNIEG